ncbi:MAG TPA: alpha/beta fold hydrolase [Roseomonas sp.]|jgi:pimeloyl-ACP methyl ester carboxylesterase
MKRRTFVAGVAASGASAALAASGLAQESAGTATPAAEASASTPQRGYAPVNGLQMYYEIHGEGEPLVLVHGAFGAVDQWGSILSTLAADHQVIAVDLQGHGRTADIDRPFTYDAFADDVAGLMDHLGVAHADVVGYSMGATIVLRFAMRHPARVRKLVVISGGYRQDGSYPDVLASIQEITPDVFAGTPIEEAYLRNAANPEDFPALVDKASVLVATDFAWSEADVRAIAAPTLLIYADSDNFRLEHMVELFRLLGRGMPGDLTGLPKSQLAIIPGATHVGLVVDRTHLWLPMVTEFLDEPLPEAG